MHLLYKLWITQPATVKTDTYMDVKNSLLKITVKIPELVSPAKIFISVLLKPDVVPLVAFML